jgi:hypothetical protein
LLESASDQDIEDKPKNVPKRQKLPENLERIDDVLNPDPICPDCGGESFRSGVEWLYFSGQLLYTRILT